MIEFLTLKDNITMQNGIKNNIPDELKKMPNWVAFKLEKSSKQKLDKKLINPNFKGDVWAKANNNVL